MSIDAQRILIYPTLVLLCSAAGGIIDGWSGAMMFLSLAALVEALCWFGLPRPGWYRHRQQRTLFN